MKKNKKVPETSEDFSFFVDDYLVEWDDSPSKEKQYVCEFCGIYTASAPRCNKCEEEFTGISEF